MNYLYSLIVEFCANHNFPKYITYILFPIIPFIIVFIAMVLIVLGLVLLERKLLGYFTQRKGPNRVGYWGLLQTLADAFKLLCKENITPSAADKFLFMIAPIIAFVPALMILSIIPFSQEFNLLPISTNLLLYLVLAFVPVLGILLGGYASNNKYSVIGGIRSVIQAISYELPIAFTVLGIVVLSSSLNLNDIILAQVSQWGIFSWFVIPAFIGFVVLFVSILAELNRCPFDLPEAESELVAGYSTEYSGIRFALFYLAEYSMMFASAAFIVVLFLGGYLSPFGVYLSNLLFGTEGAVNLFVYIEQLFWFFAKTFVLIFLFILVRATLPRLQSEKLLNLSWTVLLPLSFLNLFICMLVKILGGLR